MPYHPSHCLSSKRRFAPWLGWLARLSAFPLLALSSCTPETRFTVTVENVSDKFELLESGAFPSEEDDYASGPIAPGQAYVFRVQAAPGHRLSFASMLVESNDWFVGTPHDGVALFDEKGNAVSGDISSQLHVWDAGTELDEPFGEGESQAPRQSAHDFGSPDPVDTVRVVPGWNGADYARVELEFDGKSTFIVTLINNSGTAGPATPLAPGVFAVHSSGHPMFEEGERDRGLGLEDLAEDGDPSFLIEPLRDRTGLRSSLSPGLWVVHEDGELLFKKGQKSADRGLERLAEDGDPKDLQRYLTNVDAAAAFGAPGKADELAPLAPGKKHKFSFYASEGRRLSLATMVMETNDEFIATAERGIPLFDDGVPVNGALGISVWEAGTEVNQTPGVGPDQAARQTNPGDGAAENKAIEKSDRPASDLVRITIATE
jgi:Spondin_N